MGEGKYPVVHGLPYHAKLKMRPSLAVACLSLLWGVGCTGCAGFLNPTSERSVAVSGKIANIPPEATCTVRLLTPGGGVAGDLTVRREFRRSFVVAPGDAAKYYVEIACAGQPGSFRSTMYEVGGVRKTLDLGTIELR